MQQRTLSILILTFNRCESLKLNLEYHCQALREENLESEIIIYVMDNSSEDRTKEYVEDLCRKYSNLRYHRNQFNVGMDKNLLLGLELVNSKYVWCLQDHSKIYIARLRAVLRLLEDDSNYSYIYAPLEGSINSHLLSKTEKEIIFHSTNLSNNIFNKEMILPYYQKHIDKFNGSWLVFFISNLEMILGNSSHRVLILPFISAKYLAFSINNEREKNTWSGKFKSYCNITYHYSKIINYISSLRLLNSAEIKQALYIKNSSLTNLHAFIKLRKIDSKKLTKEKAEIIASNPIYNPLYKHLIIKSLTGGLALMFLLNILDIFIAIYLKKFSRVF